jgi:hypothetical protein
VPEVPAKLEGSNPASRGPGTQIYGAIFLVLLFISLTYAAILLSGLRTYIQGEPGGFSVFYSAAQQVRAVGFKGLYDKQLQERFHPGSMNGGYFYHLPYELLVLLPLSYLSKSAAFVLWTSFNLSCLWLGARILQREVAPLPTIAVFAFAPALVMCANGQDSGLLFLLLVLSMKMFTAEKDLAASILLAIALFKFQYAVPIGLVLGWRHARFGRASLAAISTAFLISWALVGGAGLNDYLRLLRDSKPDLGQMMANLRGVAEALLGLGHAGIVLALSAILIGWVVTRRRKDRREDFGIAVLASWLVSYHSHFYDASILVIPIAVSVKNARRNLDLWPLLLVMVSPLLLPFPTKIWLTAVPLLVLLVAMMRMEDKQAGEVRA